MTVTAAGPDGAADAIRMTVAVTKTDRKGMVTLLEMHPRSGAAATSIPADPDSGVTGTTWRGAGSGAPDGGRHRHKWGNAGERHVGGEWRGEYLRVTATHTDGEGSGKRADATAANAVTGTSVNTCIEILVGGPMGPVTQMGPWASDCASGAKSGSCRVLYL